LAARTGAPIGWLPPAVRGVHARGGWTSRSLQILSAKESLISRCRGSVEVLCAARLTYTLWFAPGSSSTNATRPSGSGRKTAVNPICMFPSWRRATRGAKYLCGRLSLVAEFPDQDPVVLSGIAALETKASES